MKQTQQAPLIDALSCANIDDAAIVNVEIRTSYKDVSDTDFVPFVDAAIRLGRGGLARVRISHFVILELDRRFLAGKEKDGFFTFDGAGYKSVTALCAHLGISRKHYYSIRNNGQRQLTAEEQTAKDDRLKLQKIHRDRLKKQKAEDRKNEIADAVKPLQEELRIAEASITAANAANVVRENETDSQAVSLATTMAAQEKAPSRKQAVSKETLKREVSIPFNEADNEVKSVQLALREALTIDSVPALVKHIRQDIARYCLNMTAAETRNVYDTVRYALTDGHNLLQDDTVTEATHAHVN
jgi:hypothetical protein